MLPIRRFLFRELIVTFGAMVVVMLALAWVGLNRALESRSAVSVVPIEGRSSNGFRKAEQLRQAQLSVLAGIGVLLLAFAAWRLRRLARQFGAQLEALAESTNTLGQGRVPEPLASEVKEFRDLGEALHQAGESLRNEAELRQQLERSQRLETMGTLTGGIAHDVNNQLATILGQINLGRELLGEDHPARRHLVRAEDAAERCALMIKSLLSFTHPVKPQLRSVDLNTLVASTSTLLDRVLGGLIRIELNLTPDLPSVLGEPVQLEQILLNLAVNARDAMPQGGRLTLRTEPCGTGQVRLTVRDTGTGIPAEVLPRIFEPYFTTKSLGKGSGLGLAMVRNLVEGHGGRIEVKSDPGDGAEFHLHLNIHREPSPAQGEATTTVQQPRHFAGKRILVAEDDPNLRELLADALTQARAQVETAQDGLVAWALFQQSRYDLVISDHRMPECTGLELLRRIRASGSRVPVILASGYGLEGLEGELAKDAWLRFFPKPFAIRSLFAAGWDLLETAPSPTIEADRC